MSGERLPIDELAEEFVARYRSGERPALSEFVRRRPDLADKIQELFPALVLLEEMAPASSSSTPPAPHQLGDYRIVREIGRGGMGVVYEAVQESLGRHVALKVLPTHAWMGATYLERFRREVRMAAQLHHTNIVPVFGTGEQDGVHYYAMQFIQGQGLDHVLKEVCRLRGMKASMTGNAEAARLSESLWSGQFQGSATDPMKESPEAETSTAAPNGSTENGQSLSSLGRGVQGDRQPHAYFRAIAQLGVQIAEALAYAHSQGILHRDIKPSNLLLDARGTVWITDFGLAKAVASADHPGEAELTSTGDIVGTLRYLAPERLGGDADPRSDVYSLGLTLYEMLTLRPALGESDRARLVRQVTEHEPIRPRNIDPRIPRDLETIVLKSAEKEPAARYPSAGELADDLRRCLADLPIRARRVRASEQLARWCRRNPVTAILLSSILLLLLVIAIGASSMTWQLQKHLQRTEDAEHTANLRLYDSLVAQARATRRSGKVGQRFDSLQALSDAARLANELGLDANATMELRNEAIACLAYRDVRRLGQLPSAMNAVQANSVVCDTRLEHIARKETNGDIVVCRLEDGVELARFPSEGRYHRGMRFSPDGRYLAMLSAVPKEAAQNNLMLWQWRQGTTARQLDFVISDRTFDFTADGTRIVGCEDDGTVHVADVATGQSIRRFKSVMVKPWHLAVDPEGRRVALSSSRSLNVPVYELETGKIARQLAHPAAVGPLAWHPDGNILAASCHDSLVHLWGLDSGREFAALPSQYNFGANDLAFAAHGNLLMSWAWDGVVRLWNPWTGQQLVSCRGVSAFLTKDGSRLVTRTGNDLSLWEVTPGSEYAMLPNPPAPNGERLNYRTVDCGWDERFLAIGGDDGVRLWDLASDRMTAHLALGRVGSGFFRQDGHELIYSGANGLFRLPVRLEDHKLVLGPPRQVLPHGQSLTFLLDRDAGTMGTITTQGARLWDLEAPTQPGRLLKHPGTTNLILSPNREWVGTFPWNARGVKIWRYSTGELVRDLLPDTLIARGWFSPDSRWLATASDKYRLWRVGSWEVVREIEREAGRDHPGGVAWSDDGKILAVLLSSTAIQLQDAESGKPLATLQAPETDPVDLIQFLDRNRRLAALASSPGRIRMWDLPAIREQLAKLGLDWDGPPLPVARERPAPPIRVEFVPARKEPVQP